MKKTAREAVRRSAKMLQRGELSPQMFRKEMNHMKNTAYFCGITEKEFLSWCPEGLCGRCAQEAGSLTDFYELSNQETDMDLLVYDRVERPLLETDALWHTRLCPCCMRERLFAGRNIPQEIGRMEEYRRAYRAQTAAGGADNGLKAFVDEAETYKIYRKARTEQRALEGR